jgi:hypothetical protein
MAFFFCERSAECICTVVSLGLLFCSIDQFVEKHPLCFKFLEKIVENEHYVFPEWMADILTDAFFCGRLLTIDSVC